MAESSDPPPKHSRASWNKPPLELLVEFLRREDRLTRRGRARRAQFIAAEFGPPADMFHPGIPAMFAFHEMQTSFVNGNDMATVLAAQVFIEHALAHPFILSGEDAIATSGFAKLIDESADRNYISVEVKDALHELRRMRNPYTHASIGMSSRSYIKRLSTSGIWNPHKLARRDAIHAIRTVVDYLRDGSPDWAPGESEDPTWWKVYDGGPRREIHDDKPAE